MPWKLTSPLPPSWTTFGVSSTKSLQLRAFTGRLATSCWSTVCETSVFSVSMSGLSLETWTIGGDAAGGEGGVDGEDLADGEDEVLAVDLAEGAAAEDDLIVAGLEEGGAVLAVVVGEERARDAGVGIGDDDGGVRDGGAGGVGDGAGDVADAGGLGWERQDRAKPTSAVEVRARSRLVRQGEFIRGRSFGSTPLKQSGVEIENMDCDCEIDLACQDVSGRPENSRKRISILA